MNLDWHHTFQEVTKAIKETGERYADAKAESWYADEITSSIKASLMQKCGDIPVSKAEKIALASPEYKQHLEGVRELKRKELKLKAECDKLNAEFEGYRSLISLEKKFIHSE